MIGEAGFEDDASISNRYAALRSNVISAVRTAAPAAVVAADKASMVDCEGAVERLWEYCESSQGEMKLILPDSVYVPYYLPQPKKTQLSPAQEEERQRKRLEAHIQSMTVSRAQKPNHNAIKHCTFRTLTSREQAIESRIMDKYRVNPDMAKGILTKFRSMSIGRSEEPLALYTLHEKSEMLSLAPDRHLRASARRDELIASKEQHFKEVGEVWVEKIKKQEHEHHEALPIAAQRQAMWIKKIAALARLHRLYLVVVDVQERRRQDYKRWDAASKIQRVYRVHYYRRLHRNDPHHTLLRQRESPLERIKRNMLNSGQAVVTYQTRQQACTVILSILHLTSKTWKSILLGFVRKVKLIQRRFRLHREFNNQRVEMIVLFLDRIFPAFFAHSQLVLAGKGEDLQNLLSMDLSRIQEATKPFRRFSVTNGLLSFAVHAQLRHAANTVRLVSRFFGPAAKLHLYDMTAVKRKILIAWLFKKRYAFITQTLSLKRACMTTRHFAAQEVRSFIQGGQDPLQKYLQEEQAAQDEDFREYYESKTGAKSVEVIKRYTRGQVMFPLFSTMTAEELCSLYLQITEAAQHVVSSSRKPPSGGGSAGGGAGTGIIQPLHLRQDTPLSSSSASSDAASDRRPSLAGAGAQPGSRGGVGSGGGGGGRMRLPIGRGKMAAMDDGSALAKSSSPRRPSITSPRAPRMAMIQPRPRDGDVSSETTRDVGQMTAYQAKASKTASSLDSSASFALSSSSPRGQMMKGPSQRAIVGAKAGTQSVVAASPHRAQPPTELLPSRRAAVS